MRINGVFIHLVDICNGNCPFYLCLYSWLIRFEIMGRIRVPLFCTVSVIRMRKVRRGRSIMIFLRTCCENVSERARSTGKWWLSDVI